MMRQMRENTKWIMLVTALAFVALMVFEWGMDVSGRSAGSIGEIGRVNGTPVLYDQYMAAYRNLYDQVQNSQTGPVTSQQNREIEDAAFEQVVNQILIQQELERRGIEVSDQEIIQAARFSPPPELRESPVFQTEGRFDIAKYQQFLASPQADDLLLLQLEAYYRDVIPRGKLLRQVSTGLFVTDAELWRQWRDRNETVTVRYIPLNPAQRIPDDSVTVTEAEIRRYWEEHQDDFQMPARASVKVAVLSKAATAADSAAALERAREARREIQEGADFAEVARRISADSASAVQGGDLGTFGPGDMVAEFDSAAFAQPVGQVGEPLRTQYGWHVIRIDERWGQDSVRARHVLVPIEPTDESEIRLLTLADSLEDLTESRSLDDAARQMGLQTQTVELSEAFPIVAGAGQVGEGADWVFEEATPGEVSPLFETPQAFYAFELVEKTPAGILPLERAESSIRQILLFEKKMAKAREQGRAVVERARAGTPLATAASQLGFDLRETGAFSRVDVVPGLGRQNAAIGAAFGLQPGRVSDVVETPTNAFVLEQIARTPADSAAWEAQKEEQRRQVMSQLQQQRLDEWLAGLRESAEVVDRRDEVLAPADDQALPPGGFMGF